MSQRTVATATPTLPHFVNDVGQDGLYNITLLGGFGVVAAGTVLGEVTATGKYVPYTDAGTHGVGSDTAKGVLYYSVDTGLVADGDSADALGSLMVRGDVRPGSLVGLTAAARVDLAAKFFFAD